MSDLLVYTAVFADRDIINFPKTEGYDFRFFTDDPIYESHPDAIFTPLPIAGDPRRSSRYFKVMPQVFFPGYRRWIWLDGNLSVREGVKGEVLNAIPGPIATFKHRHRECCYDEADICTTFKLDDEGLIGMQMDGYLKEGFAPKQGLGETMMVIRDNTPEVRRFNRNWWREVSVKSVRDQLSFNYVLWRLKIPVYYMGTIDESALFLREDHASDRSRAEVPEET